MFHLWAQVEEATKELFAQQFNPPPPKEFSPIIHFDVGNHGNSIRCPTRLKNNSIGQFKCHVSSTYVVAYHFVPSKAQEGKKWGKACCGKLKPGCVQNMGLSGIAFWAKIPKQKSLLKFIYDPCRQYIAGIAKQLIIILQHTTNCTWQTR